MRYNRLGRTGLFVSELCLGTMTFGASGRFEALGTVEQSAADAMLARAFEAGVTFVDTADTYSSGESERMLGRALKNVGRRRDDVVLATKVFGHTGAGPNDHGSSRAHVLAAAKASLARLGTDYIDLYQLHGFDPATPVEETLRALDDLVRQGHVRYIGVSNWAAWQIATALGVSALHGLARFASLQAYYSLAGRDLERELVPMLASEGLGLLVWSPLAGGLLGGKISRDRPSAEGTRRDAMPFPPVDLPRAYDVIDVLRAQAERRSVSVARLAVAWLLHQKIVTSVVIGARRIEQMEETLGATEIVIDEADLAELDRASRLPAEYPGWMLDLWSGPRSEQLASTRQATLA